MIFFICIKTCWKDSDKLLNFTSYLYRLTFMRFYLFFYYFACFTLLLLLQGLLSSFFNSCVSLLTVYFPLYTCWDSVILSCMSVCCVGQGLLFCMGTLYTRVLLQALSRRFWTLSVIEHQVS